MLVNKKAFNLVLEFESS